jgi:hypothetical protein
MDTQDLIDRLAAEGAARPASCWTLELRLALGTAAGFGAVALAVLATLGLRPDLAPSLLHGAGLMKFGGGVALAAGAFHLLRRLGRPGTPPVDAVCLGLFALALAVVLGALALARVTAPLDAVLRATPHYAWMMVALGLMPLGAVLIALRGAAPTRPEETGAVAGLLAGAVASLGYALWCPADDVLFVAVSYGAAVLATVATGALAGARLLRW